MLIVPTQKDVRTLFRVQNVRFDELPIDEQFTMGVLGYGSNSFAGFTCRGCGWKQAVMIPPNAKTKRGRVLPSAHDCPKPPAR